MKSIVKLCTLALLFGLVGDVWLLMQTVPQTVQDAGGVRLLLAYHPEWLWATLGRAFSLTWWGFLFPIGLVCAGVCLSVRHVWKSRVEARKKRRTPAA